MTEERIKQMNEKMETKKVEDRLFLVWGEKEVEIKTRNNGEICPVVTMNRVREAEGIPTSLSINQVIQKHTILEEARGLMEKLSGEKIVFYGEEKRG